MSETNKRRVEYHAPSEDILDGYAYEVCRQLGADFEDLEIRRGFAKFVKVLAAARAKAANRGHGELDNEIE